MNAALTAPPLVFSWAPPRRRARALVFFLIASALLHALAFYAFQIIYPPAVALLPAPARISVIAPNDPESTALLRWVEAEDPALATMTLKPPDSKGVSLPAISEVPSYANYQPQLRLLPEATPDVRIPSASAPGAVRRSRPALSAVAPLLSHKTTLLLGDAPADFPAAVTPSFTWRASKPDAPDNARFRIALDPGGAVQFCFMINSSGDPELDDQARRFLALCRFPPKQGDSKLPDTSNEQDAPSNELTWLVATVLWGNDINLPAGAGATAAPP